MRTYREPEARALGLLDEDDEPRRPAGGHGQRQPRARRRELARRAPPQDGDQVKTDGSNAVQILLLVGGLSLVPALLFTVTGFTRILIVLGFIRTGLGTPTAPPNQVLVGIALFLTIFVMTPTFNEDQRRRDRAAARRARSRRRQAFKRAEEPMREFMFDQTRTKRPRAVRQARARSSARRRARTSRPTS